jgi:hypothetical protein
VVGASVAGTCVSVGATGVACEMLLALLQAPITNATTTTKVKRFNILYTPDRLPFRCKGEAFAIQSTRYAVSSVANASPLPIYQTESYHTALTRLCQPPPAFFQVPLNFEAKGVTYIKECSLPPCCSLRRASHHIFKNPGVFGKRTYN